MVILVKSRVRLATILALMMTMAACGEATTDTTAGPGTTADASYPESGTQWIIPFAPGGGADASFRVFMKYADALSDTSMSVVNIEGAGGVTGWSQFVGSPPDGYTLTLATPPFNLIPKVLLPESTPYELEQFQYMCVFAVSPNALLVAEDDDRFSTLEDVLDYLRENPGGLAAAGDGAAGTDAIHRFQLEGAADVEFTYVSGDSAGNSQKLIAGDVDVMFSDTSWTQLQAGKIRALAVASVERHPSFPDVPSYTELGYDVVGARLRAPAAPPGTPANVIAYWEDICRQVTENPQFVEEIEAIGQPVQFMDSQQATSFIEQMVRDIQRIADEQDLVQE